MNCEHVHKVLDAYLDHELDHATHAQIALHLSSCAGCHGLLAEREVLGEALRRLPRHALPEALLHAISSAIAPADRAGDHATDRTAGRTAATLPRRAFPSWRSLGLGAAGAALVFLLGIWVGAPSRLGDTREPFIARHVASLGNPRNLVQVSSSDRHTVKPWFAGRIDFAPPVRELQSAGFELLGGRLDRLNGRSAAALVYRIREHHINLFVWRIDAPGSELMMASTVHGYSVAAWAAEGLGFAAVSDVDAQDLQRFTELVRSPPR